MKNSMYILYCSSKNGLGHLRRFLTISRFLTDIKFKLVVIEEIGTRDILNQYNERLNDTEIILLNELNETTLSEILAVEKYDFIFLDKKNIDIEIYQMLKNLKFKIIVFDDTNFGREYADILIDANVHKKSMLNKYYGEKYIIFNDRMFKYKNKIKQINKKIKNIFVCFGGTDVHNIAEKFLSVSRELPEYEFYIFSNKLKNSHNIKNIHIMTDTEKIAKIMFDSDLGFVNGGLLMYEALFLGLPVVIINQNQDELINARYFEYKKIVKNKKIYFSVSNFKIKNTILKLDKDFEYRKRVSKLSRCIVDGKGINRLKKLIEKKL